MKNGKYSKRRGVASKTLVLALAVMLIVGATVGGTIAWLTSTSGPVVNTFSTSGIGATLDESDDLDLKMVPGWTITKDPKAGVTAESEDCYLFVTVAKENNFDNFMTYEIADGWTQLETGVYYRIFDSNDATNANVKGAEYSVLKDDQVLVKDTVTKEDMSALTANTYPKLTFKAYAVQLYKSNSTTFTPAKAWNIAKGLT